MATNIKKCKFSNPTSGPEIRSIAIACSRALDAGIVTWQWAPAISIMHSALPGIPQSSKPVLISEQRQWNIEIRNMPPRKRPGPKEPLYTSVRLSWPPLKLQFQFDHTRRVVDARSRIDAIGIWLRITLLLYRLNRASRERASQWAVNMNYTIIHIYLISIHKDDFQLQRHHLQSKQVDAT